MGWPEQRAEKAASHPVHNDLAGESLIR
jgi:hypothetical protein